MQAFFLPGLSFTETDDSQDNRSREGTIVFYFLLIPRAHERSDIYFQLCMWDDYHIFLITSHVITPQTLTCVFHVEMTWKRLFPRRFNVEYTWSVCRVQYCYSMIFDLLVNDANFFLMISSQTQDVNWTCVRRSKDVQDVFWTSYVRSIYVLCLRGGF